MRLRVTIALLFCLFFWQLSVFAQQATTVQVPQRDAKTIGLIQRLFAARSGSGATIQVQTILTQGSHIPDPDAPPGTFTWENQFALPNNKLAGAFQSPIRTQKSTSFVLFFLQSISSNALNTAANSVVLKAKSALGQVNAASAPISATGDITAIGSGQAQSFHLDVLSPDTFMVQIGSTEAGYVWTANHGFVTIRSNGQVRKLPIHLSFAERCAFLPVQSILYDPSAVSVEIATTTTVAPASTQNSVLSFEYHAPVVNDSDIVAVKQIEFDATSGLPVRLVESNQNQGNPDVKSQMEYTYADYRAEGSMMLPHIITIRADGQVVAMVSLKQFVIDAALDPAEFAVN